MRGNYAGLGIRRPQLQTTNLQTDRLLNRLHESQPWQEGTHEWKSPGEDWAHSPGIKQNKFSDFCQRASLVI